MKEENQNEGRMVEVRKDAWRRGRKEGEIGKWRCDEGRMIEVRKDAWRGMRQRNREEMKEKER